ncbi:NADP-dependent oxidoreductase [Alloscardovia omnicolens]|uniref:NADP-dependent oxidoreductase n=1 Tax=Alloscardovia omnicolens TaxID=419015 RepID=UPI003A721DEB
MKAAQVEKYNKANISLKIVDVDTPSIGEKDVLIKVLAAGVNPVDNLISRGEVKMIVSYKLPLIAGNEVVGTVEKIGSQVSNFQVGERVFARLPLEKIGAFAQYVSVAEDALARVPAYLSDVEAAATPLTALTVMQAYELMRVEAGKTIFISGGTGGVGAMAIPIAKAKGLHVITNGSADNEERVKALGADQFIDYKTQYYASLLSDVDYVLDTLGGAQLEKQFSVLKKGGTLVSLRGMPNGAFAKRMGLPWWKQLLFSFAGRSVDAAAARYGVNYHFIFVQSNGQQLQEVADIFEQVKVKPSIDAVYPFEDINIALDKIANGHSKGKTVMTMEVK